MNKPIKIVGALAGFSVVRASAHVPQLHAQSPAPYPSLIPSPVGALVGSSQSMSLSLSLFLLHFPSTLKLIEKYPLVKIKNIITSWGKGTRFSHFSFFFLIV